MTENTIGVKAYVSTNVQVGGATVASAFHQVRLIEHLRVSDPRLVV
jgi:hypothetical protein